MGGENENGGLVGLVGLVLWWAGDNWKKIMYYFEKCLSFMKFLSTDVPLTDAKLICIPL